MELQNEIAQLAYELYEISGREEGRDLANWLEGEHLILLRNRAPEENVVQNETGTETTEASKVDIFSETEKEAALV